MTITEKKIRHNEICRNYYKRHIDVLRVKGKEYARIYRKNNLQKIREYARNYYHTKIKITSNPNLIKRGRNLGYKVSQATKEKISQKNKISVKNFYINGGSPYNKGKKMPERSGKNHFAWIENKSDLKKFNDIQKDRRSSSYNYWRRQICERDEWKCKINNKECNGRLEVHHILSYTDFPELRYDINNGIVLCHAHHPRKRAEEKRLSPYFMELVSVSKE